VGDVIFNTNIQVFKGRQKTISLAVNVGIRMPSGGAQGTARYTDCPGYWITIGWGKPFQNTKYKWIGMFGFMAWQTNNDVERQDDAGVFGTGIERNYNDLRLQAYIAGYIGWRKNGDKPVVFRMNFEKEKKNIVYIIRFQQGLHDFGYTSLETGAKFILGK
jgi:nucleoside-specific outer membrane channel protein Tsx